MLFHWRGRVACSVFAILPVSQGLLSGLEGISYTFELHDCKARIHAHSLVPFYLPALQVSRVFLVPVALRMRVSQLSNLYDSIVETTNGTVLYSLYIIVSNYTCTESFVEIIFPRDDTSVTGLSPVCPRTRLRPSPGPLRSQFLVSLCFHA